MSKIHYRDDSVTKYVPHYIMYEYKAKGIYGAICGYVRSQTTLDKNKVTCFNCKQELKRRDNKQSNDTNKRIKN